MIILILALSLAVPATAAGDEAEWKSIIFDKSSDSYKRAFDLRSGKYTTSHQTSTHGGDFIIMIGYNPSWVDFRTMDWTKVLFSTGEENDSKVDERAGRVPDRVPVHYGESYVASFGDRTYTIKLVEGYYEFAASYAEFAYHSGGTPGPEHEPPKQSTRAKPDSGVHEHKDKIKSSNTPKSSMLDEKGRIDKVKVTVKTPPPEDENSPKKDSMQLTLVAATEGRYITLHRDSMSVWEGIEKTYTFKNVLPGPYTVKMAYMGKTVTDIIDINESNTEFNFDLEKMDEGGLHPSKPEEIEKAAICESRCGDAVDSGRRRPIDKRVPPEPVPGYVRHTYICVVTPSTEDASEESAGLSVELRGPKHFRQTLKNVPPGVSRTFKFLTFPVGSYEVIAKYGDRIVTESVELLDDCTEIEMIFE